MIHRALFVLNRNKASVYEAARACAALCRERGIEPRFLEEDREALVTAVLEPIFPPRRARA